MPENKSRQKNKFLIGYDFDGTVSAGIFPMADSVIITGRNISESKDVYKKLKQLGLSDLKVIFMDEKTEKNAENISQHKAYWIKELGIKKFYEDTQEQVTIIRKLLPEVKIIQVVPDPKKFIIVSKDMSGLGFATMIDGAGHEVMIANKNDDLEDEDKESYELVAQGLIKRFTLDSVFNKRNYLKDYYWIFDMNYHSEYSDKLREEGFKVLGASEFSDKSEHDRNFGVDLVKEYGMDVPETFEFKSIEEGISHLEQNEDKAYVFKPDESDCSYLTYVPINEKPEAANKELRSYMRAIEDPGSFILQEKKKGVEVNFEVWFYEGQPFFAFCDFENKRKLNGDVGENVGCAQDIVFKVPVDSKGVQETIGKLFPFYEKEKYTGFADINVIIGDNKVYFLEFCNRFGYNSHPNLFLTLAIDSFPNIMADFIDGNIEGMDERFKSGFGASISLYIDHKRKGMPIHIPEDLEKSFFCYDYYDEGNGLQLAGYDHQVGIITAHDYTIQDASHEAISRAHKIVFPDRAFRSDMDKHDMANLPIKRYQALVSMGYVK